MGMPMAAAITLPARLEKASVRLGLGAHLGLGKAS